MLRPTLCTFLILCAFGLRAQVNMENFVTYGNAVQLDDECFRLTEDENYLSGSIQYRDAIDLNKPFRMEMEVFLGCRDEYGADGIVFIFFPTGGQLGFRGEGMGFGGLAPSLGIELDTYYNDHLFDPEEDHATVMFNGQVGHWRDDIVPVVLPNLEDCEFHPMEISWDPGEKRLSVFLDGRQIINFKGDLVNGVFQGNSQVYWGASAATGRKLNRQEVCFRKLILGKAEPLPRLNPELKHQFLTGIPIELPDFEFASGTTALTSDHHQQLDQLTDLLKQHPDLKLRIFVYTDSQGAESLNQNLSTQRAQVISNFFRQKGIPPERLFAKGFGEMYPVATNDTAQGRLANRRVEFSVLRAVP